MNIEKIIQDSAGLIYKISTSFYGVDKDDLYQAGVLGILKAYKNYHQDGETKFSSYAYDYIYGEMYKLAHNKALKVSKDILKLYKKIEQTRFSLAQKFGKVPSNNELASYLNIEETKITDAIMAGNMVMSLDNDEDMPMYDKLSFEEKTSLDDKILISESLELLNNDEKAIIKARYFEDLTQSEVAKKLAMTQVMVSRYEKKSLDKMRTYMYM